MHIYTSRKNIGNEKNVVGMARQECVWMFSECNTQWVGTGVMSHVTV